MRGLKKEIVAIIPARGGSKGIPKKNIHMIAGKPLLRHVLDQVLGTVLIGKVIVSTDDNEIACVAMQAGADVVRRPSEISTDESSSEAALLHTLEYLVENEQYVPDILVFMQCTSPLVLSEDIKAIIQVFMNTGADSALTVAPSHAFLWKQNAQGEAIAVNHDKRLRLRRQDLENEYVETGAVYVMDVAGFKKAKNRFFGKTVMYIIPEERALQIDSEHECDIAEFLLLKRQEQGE